MAAVAMQTERLVPLALPRERKLCCELCRGPATVRCGGCGVTYYCEVAHQSADWASVHRQICALLVPLRTARRFFFSDKERRHAREQRRSREKFLAELTRTVAQNFLFEGKHEDAIPAALHSLKFSISVYGSDSVELVPSYLILAEGSLGLGHLAQGEEYLSQAQWTMLKNPHCGPILQVKLHRNMGLLFAAKGNFEEALYHFANDVYFACCAFGTNHIAASGGYFHMANVFFQQNRKDIADSLYAEVVDIWYRHFSRIIEAKYQLLMSPPVLDILGEEPVEEEEAFDDEQRGEATQMLGAIVEIREHATRPNLGKLAKVIHTQAMLLYLMADVAKAQDLVKKVLRIIRELPNPEPDESLQHLIKLIDSKLLNGK